MTLDKHALRNQIDNALDNALDRAVSDTVKMQDAANIKMVIYISPDYHNAIDNAIKFRHHNVVPVNRNHYLHVAKQ